MLENPNQLQRLPRAGSARKRLLFGLLIVTACLAVGGGVAYSYRNDGSVQVITRRPTVGEFVNDIVERGDIESSSNTELRCEIASAEGIRILEIIPEGTTVKEGDVVVQLDDSTLRKELNAQRIALNTVEASYTKSKNELDAEIIARKEYELGTFVQEEQKLESELFVAEEQARRAKNYYSHSRKLAARGYITDTQLEGDRFLVDKYGKELDSATTKLTVIRDYTKPKTLKKHDSSIKTFEATVAAEKAKYEIEVEKLSNLESQLEKCVIKAPSAGQVVYNNPNRWQSEEYQIRKGNRVRERQVIVKLPDTSKMQVKAKIGEARVDRVKPTMCAAVHVEALRGSDLKGTVQSVSAYASDENWFNPNTKEYDAVIILESPPATIKPGMTSQVSIRVETIPDAIQIPVQCVVERKGKHYCIIRDTAGKLQLRELMVGSSNDKFMVIKDGVGAMDDVVMNPRAHLARVGLKDAEPGSDDSKSKNDSKSSDPATPIAGNTSSGSAS